MTYARRKDLNQSALEIELTQLGFHVADTSRLGNGFPDLVVTGYNRHINAIAALLVEVKRGRNVLTLDEQVFQEEYPLDGPYIVARSSEDILRWFGAI